MNKVTPSLNAFDKALNRIVRNSVVAGSAKSKRHSVCTNLMFRVHSRKILSGVVAAFRDGGAGCSGTGGSLICASLDERSSGIVLIWHSCAYRRVYR